MASPSALTGTCMAGGTARMGSCAGRRPAPTSPSAWPMALASTRWLHQVYGPVCRTPMYGRSYHALPCLLPPPPHSPYPICPAPHSALAVQVLEEGCCKRRPCAAAEQGRGGVLLWVRARCRSRPNSPHPAFSQASDRNGSIRVEDAVAHSTLRTHTQCMHSNAHTHTCCVVCLCIQGEPIRAAGDGPG